MFDDYKNGGHGIQNFKPKNHTALQCLQDCDDTTQAIVNFLEGQETYSASIALLLGLAYWDEPPLAIKINYQKAADFLEIAADLEDPEGLYYMASFDLSMYLMEPHPEFLSNFWGNIEALMALAKQKKPQGLIKETMESLPGLIKIFKTTDKAHWPEGATDEAMKRLGGLTKT